MYYVKSLDVLAPLYCCLPRSHGCFKQVQNNLMWKFAFMMFCTLQCLNHFGDYMAGQSYSYLAIDSVLRGKIEIASSITQVEVYGSHTYDDSFQHSILFEMDGVIWGVVSFGKDGLDAFAALSRGLILRRNKYNIRLGHRHVNVPAQRISHFLELHSQRKYHLLGWNDVDFSSALWDAIVK